MERLIETTQTMYAAWYEKQGAAQDVIQYGEMPVPSPGAGEVRVKIHASGVNPSDTKSRSGWGGITMPFPRVIPHNDGAGVIDSVGEGVPTSRIGERVWIYEAQRGRAFGTAAEFVVTPSNLAVHLPDNTSFAEGACLGVPAMTAHRCIFADGPVNGQTILVTGGAGAVGYYALQLAKWGGATVITTVSRPEQVELVQAVSADHVINYKTEDVVQRIQEITGVADGRGVDRVVDVNFAANLPTTIAVVRPNGAIASYSSGGSDDHPALPFQLLLLNNITIRGVLVYTMPDEAKQMAICDITAALEAGALRHNIAQRFPLTEVAAAHETQGKDSGGWLGYQKVSELNTQFSTILKIFSIISTINRRFHCNTTR